MKLCTRLTSRTVHRENGRLRCPHEIYFLAKGAARTTYVLVKKSSRSENFAP